MKNFILNHYQLSISFINRTLIGSGGITFRVLKSGLSAGILWTNAPKLLNFPKKCYHAVAKFRLATGHDCLLKHLYRNKSAQEPFYRLCNLWEEIDADHLRRCRALPDSCLCDRYWSARDIKSINAFLAFYRLF